MNTATITSEALSLPVKQRAELAAQLLSSLDALSESEIEPLWLQEAARRAEEMDQGCALLLGPPHRGRAIPLLREAQRYGPHPTKK